MSRGKEPMGDSPTPNLSGSSDHPLLLVPRNSKRKLGGMLKWIRLAALHPGNLSRPERKQLGMMTARARQTREVLFRATAVEMGREFPPPVSVSPGKKKKSSEESSEPRQQPSRKSLRLADKKESKDRQPELGRTTTGSTLTQIGSSEGGDPTNP